MSGIDFANMDDWRRFILSPAARDLRPVRYAVVPWSDEPGHLDEPQWQPMDGPVPLACAAGASLLFDFGSKVTGHLRVGLRDCGHAQFAIRSGPVLGLVRFPGTLAADCTSDPWWQDGEYRALRFCQLRVESPADASKAAVELGLAFSAMPVEYRGHFVCSDETLTRIWFTGAYTLHLCMQPHRLSSTYAHLMPPERREFISGWESPHGEHVIWDGPRRDREVWVGDMWPEMMTALYAFGAVDPVKSSLACVAAQQFEDGSIPGSGASRQRFAEYSCWWVVLLDRFHLLTGDRAFVAEMAPHLRLQLHWLRRQLAENDGWLMVNKQQTWAWTLARVGVVTGSQCVAYGALRAGARLLAELGDAGVSSEFSRLADAMQERIRTHLWNDAEGVFKDSLAPTDGVARYSCDSNAMALLFHVATPGMAERAMAFLRARLWGPFGTRTIDPVEPPSQWNWAHNHNVWPFVVGLEVEARFENGAHESAMEPLRSCWGNMITHNAETFWEMVDGRDGSFVTRVRVADTGNPESDTWDSYCHGWSAGVAFMLQGYVLGVIPVEPGFRRLRIAPRLGDLTHARGTVPTPLGDVTVNAERRDGRMVAEVDIPAGAEALVTLGGKETLVGAGFHRLEGGCDG